MKEGLQSPVFKKRFARRKTTTRPFTFAYNFETENTSAAQNQVVKQVGDRGVVITTSVQLNESNEGQSISDIVQSSPVPVLIAHTSPKDNQKDITNQGEDDQLEISFCRRSGRSRQPSDSFLARLQHPHGRTPIKSFLTPDNHYIGSKNNSNIDAEVSFGDEIEPAKRSRKKEVSSSGTSKMSRARITQNSSALETSVSRTKEDRHEASKVQEVTSSSKKKVPPAAVDAGKQVSSANNGSQRSSKRKEKEQLSLSKTVLSSPRNVSSSTASNRKSKSVKSDLSKLESSASLRDNQDRLSVLKGNDQSRTRSSRRVKPAAVSASESTSEDGGHSSVVSQTRISKTPLEEDSILADADEESDLPVVRSGRRSSRRVKPAAVSASEDGGHSSVVSQTRISKTPLEEDSSLADADEESDLPVVRSGRRRKGLAVRNLSATSKVSKHNSVLDVDTANISAAAASGKRSKRLVVGDVSTASASEKNGGAVAFVKRKDSALVSTPRKKRGISAVETSDMSSTPQKKRTGLAIEQKNREMPATSKVSQGRAGRPAQKKQMSKEVSQSSIQERPGQSASDLSLPTAASGHRKRAAVDDLTEIGLSPEKRETLRANSSSSPRKGFKRKPTSSQSAKRKNKTSAPASVSTQNSSKPDTNATVHDSESAAPPSLSQASASPTRPGSSSQALQKCASPRRFFKDPGRSPEKLVSHEIIGVRNSPRKGIPKILNSFWKTTRRISSERQSSKPWSRASVSTVYDDDAFGDPSSVRLKEIKAPHAGQKRHEDHSPEDHEKTSKGRKVLTELDVIIRKMDEIEAEMMEEDSRSKVCKKAVQKAFTFTRKQLLETMSQLTKIKELTSQINKLKHRCKLMSNESRENHDQKCYFRKELQSLQDRGIDSDMLRIDEWIQDFQALRQDIV